MCTPLLVAMEQHRQILTSVPNSLIPEMEFKPLETVILRESGTTQILFLMAQNVYLETLFSKFLSTDKYTQVAPCEIYPQGTDRGAKQSPSVRARYR